MVDTSNAAMPNATLKAMLLQANLFSIRSLLALCVLTLYAAQTRAAELVTLRSGFTIRCVARETVSADTVRLHMAGSNAADNYLDVPLANIARVDPVADEAPLSRTAAKPIDTGSILSDAGARHNVNTALLAAVVQAESAGNARAVSRTGARGLMQLMPATAASLGVDDSFSPAANVNGGSTYLDRLLTRYHDNLPLALAAYNAGPAAVDRYRGIPPFRETRLYVAKVIREFNRRVAAAASPAAVATATRR